MSFRLTIHVENQPKVDTRPATKFRKKGEQKNAVQQAMDEAKKQREKVNVPKVDNKGRYKVYTTLSFLCNTKRECIQKLSELRSQYNIAIGKDHNKPEKYNEELWQISNVN